MQDAFSSVNKALELDPNDPEAHRIMGAVKLLFEKDMESAIYHHEKAIEICPSDTFHISRYAILNVYMGNPKKGLEEIKRAMRIDPFCSDLMLEVEGICYFWLEKYSEALSSFKKLKIDTRDSLFYSAATSKSLNSDDKASEFLKKAYLISNMKIDKFVESQPYKSSNEKNILIKLLNSIV